MNDVKSYIDTLEVRHEEMEKELDDFHEILSTYKNTQERLVNGNGIFVRWQDVSGKDINEVLNCYIGVLLKGLYIKFPPIRQEIEEKARLRGIDLDTIEEYGI